MVNYDYVMLCKECQNCKHVETCLDTRYGEVNDNCYYFEIKHINIKPNDGRFNGYGKGE